MVILNLLLLSICLFNVTACSLFTKKGNWGKKALWPLSGSKISQAFKKNISSPHVWAPAAAAGVIYFSENDKKLSEDVHEKNRVFQTEKNSSHWSDQLADVLMVEMFVTPLFTASADEEGGLTNYVANKVKGYTVIGLATRAADYTRDRIADTAKRQRPNKVDYRSFPSGHSTQAGSRNIVVSRNLDAIPMDNRLRIGLKSINTAMAGTLIYSRIEAHRHYASDVLMGYSLGAFMTGFVYDSLMNWDPESPETFTFVPMKDQFSLQYTYYF